MEALLEIEGLHARAGGADVLRGVDLSIGRGEVHAVMGPNGSGKSTLSYVLAGRPGYEVTAGLVRYRGHDLLAMTPEARAAEGLFLAFQYPVEIPGVAGTTFLKHALNAVRKHRGEPELDAAQVLQRVRDAAGRIAMPADLLKRAVNTGFSGGEKKRSEVLQMALLEPVLAVLDETDSGLDIDALTEVAGAINGLRGPERSFLVITHYQRLLEYVVPDHVHVLAGGRIQRSGGSELALELERTGYAGFSGAAA